MGSKPKSFNRMVLSKRKEFLRVITLRSSIPRDKSSILADRGSVMVFNFRTPGILITRYRLSNVSQNRILKLFPDFIARRSANGMNRGNREVVYLGNGSLGSKALGPEIQSLLIHFCTAR